MNIKIERLNEHNELNINKCDSLYKVHSELSIIGIQDDIEYVYHHLLFPYEKRLPDFKGNPKDYLGMSDCHIFFAYGDDILAGQMSLRRDQRGYCLIEDLRVEPQFRKNNIGRRLFLTALNFAVENGMPGLTIEIQNSNTDACQFLEKCGFILGGFDTYRYKLIKDKSHEIALYWYFEI